MACETMLLPVLKAEVYSVVGVCITLRLAGSHEERTRGRSRAWHGKWS